MKCRVRKPPARGTTTNNTMERISVSQGTKIFVTPNRKDTIGTNATRIIRSLTGLALTYEQGHRW